MPRSPDSIPPDNSESVSDLTADMARIQIDGPSAAPTDAPTTNLVLGHGRDPGSAHALPVAADLAQRLKAHLQVVHGVDLDDYPIDPDAADWEQQAQRALTEQRRQVEDALAGIGQSWTYQASRADPVTLLAAVAEEHDALMIIVGTRGEGFGPAVQRLLGCQPPLRMAM